MKKILLPNGLCVSEVALGTMTFGSSVSKKEAYEVLDRYVDEGGNFIDTSNNYAHWQGTGDESETLLGEWLLAGGRRERLIIATKVGFDRKGKGAGLKKEQIEYWIDESLRKLNTDYIDLYYAHTDDTETPMEETLEAFYRLIKKGKVRNIGASNFDCWRVAEADFIAKERGLVPYTVMQQKFTYLHPNFSVAPKYTFNESVNRERLRFLRDKNMPLVAYACLCKGAYEDPDRLPSDYFGGERLAFIRKTAKERGVTPSAVVIAWLTGLYRCKDYPRVIPLFSASPDHLRENLRGLKLDLTIEEMDMMNNL